MFYSWFYKEMQKNLASIIFCYLLSRELKENWCNMGVILITHINTLSVRRTEPATFV